MFLSTRSAHDDLDDEKETELVGFLHAAVYKNPLNSKNGFSSWTEILRCPWKSRESSKNLENTELTRNNR